MKADLWQPLAAEAMHWLLGEREIAKRANTVPFAIVSGVNTAGPQGEGNGRIAQANRMHDATIYFDPSALEALQTPQTATALPSPFPAQASASTNGTVVEHHPRDFEHGEISPTEGSGTQARSTESFKGTKRELTAEDGSLRLPGFADLDNEISAHVGHPGRRESVPHFPREYHMGRTAGSSPESHRSSNVSDHSHHSHQSQRLHALAEASLATKESLRQGSDGGSVGSGSGSGIGDDGYVQVPRKEIDQAPA